MLCAGERAANYNFCPNKLFDEFEIKETRKEPRRCLCPDGSSECLCTRPEVLEPVKVARRARTTEVAGDENNITPPMRFQSFQSNSGCGGCAPIMPNCCNPGCVCQPTTVKSLQQTLSQTNPFFTPRPSTYQQIQQPTIGDLSSPQLPQQPALSFKDTNGQWNQNHGSNQNQQRYEQQNFGQVQQNLNQQGLNLQNCDTFQLSNNGNNIQQQQFGQKACQQYFGYQSDIPKKGQFLSNKQQEQFDNYQPQFNPNMQQDQQRFDPSFNSQQHQRFGPDQQQQRPGTEAGQQSRDNQNGQRQFGVNNGQQDSDQQNRKFVNGNDLNQGDLSKSYQQRHDSTGLRQFAPINSNNSSQSNFNSNYYQDLHDTTGLRQFTLGKNNQQNFNNNYGNNLRQSNLNKNYYQELSDTTGLRQFASNNNDSPNQFNLDNDYQQRHDFTGAHQFTSNNNDNSIRPNYNKNYYQELHDTTGLRQFASNNNNNPNQFNLGNDYLQQHDSTGARQFTSNNNDNPSQYNDNKNYYQELHDTTGVRRFASNNNDNPNQSNLGNDYLQRHDSTGVRQFTSNNQQQQHDPDNNLTHLKINNNQEQRQDQRNQNNFDQSDNSDASRLGQHGLPNNNEQPFQNNANNQQRQLESSSFDHSHHSNNQHQGQQSGPSFDSNSQNSNSLFTNTLANIRKLIDIQIEIENLKFQRGQLLWKPMQSDNRQPAFNNGKQQGMANVQDNYNWQFGPVNQVPPITKLPGTCQMTTTQQQYCPRQDQQSVIQPQPCPLVEGSAANARYLGICSWMIEPLACDPESPCHFLQCQPAPNNLFCGRWQRMSCAPATVFDVTAQVCVWDTLSPPGPLPPPSSPSPLPTTIPTPILNRNSGWNFAPSNSYTQQQQPTITLLNSNCNNGGQQICHGGVQIGSCNSNYQCPGQSVCQIGHLVAGFMPCTACCYYKRMLMN